MSDGPQRAPDHVPAEVVVDRELVARLVASQFPDLAGEPVRFVAEGWDNAVFRVGEALAARVPRRALGVEWLEKEARWLPVLAGALPVPVPVAVHRGRAGEGYPWPWLLVPWFEGDLAGHAPLDAEEGADALADVLRALHQPAPDQALVDPLVANPFRDVTIADRREAVERLFDRHPDVPVAPLRAVLAAACEAPAHDGPRRWTHGDLHPFNVLTRSGRLAAVIDWGDLYAGDPAPDLAGVFALLPPAAHPRVRERLDHDSATWARGAGWAVFFGMMLLDAGRRGVGPAFEAAGRRTLDHLLASSIRP
ncbi:MAG: aminoglycoside phosphotransferase family protein [Alphaproteobacteria bacterium]|nr:aminoglycoside phosphotransferase family protein [Alphaproteobacteria bacterium]